MSAAVGNEDGALSRKDGCGVFLRLRFSFAVYRVRVVNMASQSYMKRQKELRRQQKQQEKAVRREQRKAEKVKGGPPIEGEDPVTGEIDLGALTKND